MPVWIKSMSLQWDGICGSGPEVSGRAQSRSWCCYLICSWNVLQVHSMSVPCPTHVETMSHVLIGSGFQRSNRCCRTDAVLKIWLLSNSCEDSREGFRHRVCLMSNKLRGSSVALSPSSVTTCAGLGGLWWNLQKSAATKTVELKSTAGLCNDFF